MNGIDVVKLYIDSLLRVGMNVPQDVKNAIGKLWNEQLKVNSFDNSLHGDRRGVDKSDVQKQADARVTEENRINKTDVRYNDPVDNRTQAVGVNPNWKSTDDRRQNQTGDVASRYREPDNRINASDERSLEATKVPVDNVNRPKDQNGNYIY